MRARCFRFGWLAAMFSGMVLLASCGDDDGGDGKSDADDESGGSGSAGRASGGGGQSGTGASGNAGSAGMALQTVACGSELCTGVSIPTISGIPACCADPVTSHCGLDTSLLATFGAMPTRSCEPLNQPGELDEACPSSPPFESGGFQLMPFAGCCRQETGTCGFLVDRLLGAIPLGLGCIDATPFLQGGAGGGTGEPVPCGGPIGSGGASGAGGSSPIEAGSGGASGSGTAEAGSGGATER